MKVPNLEIRTYGDPGLRRKALAVEHLGPGERLFIEAMTHTMYEKDGVGLAAPQVGVNKRIFVADMGEGPVAVINPKIVKKSHRKTPLEEGCLSVPGIVVNIRRPEKISVEFKDMQNKLVKRDYNGMMAKIFQHENDHLDGKLIVDYVDGKEKEKIVPHLKELENGDKRINL